MSSGLGRKNVSLITGLLVYFGRFHMLPMNSDPGKIFANNIEQGSSLHVEVPAILLLAIAAINCSLLTSVYVVIDRSR